MADKLYKVLVNGRSCHGSDMEWSLPKTTKAGKVTPGKWHSVKLPLEHCVNGFHLTKDPSKWAKPDISVFEVEIGGESLPYDNFMDKVCVQKVRLIRQLDNKEILELFNLLIVSDGYHTINSGICVASGLATVEASGSATVKASGSATVTAYGSATVEAYGSATVKAYGSATVEAYGSATVKAYGSATVTASGSATVKASGSATVKASGSATVTAYGSATVTAYGSALVSARGSYSLNVAVLVVDNACFVDYRSGKPVVKVAD